MKLSDSVPISSQSARQHSMLGRRCVRQGQCRRATTVHTDAAPADSSTRTCKTSPRTAAVPTAAAAGPAAAPGHQGSRWLKHQQMPRHAAQLQQQLPRCRCCLQLLLPPWLLLLPPLLDPTARLQPSRRSGLQTSRKAAASGGSQSVSQAHTPAAAALPAAVSMPDRGKALPPSCMRRTPAARMTDCPAFSSAARRSV